ncbi:MAG: serine/threonine protein kinase, partial [Okeania sp. SIO3H1]|nr:serine/threonine protein kinase [Okeania sp. SIO3H1]
VDEIFNYPEISKNFFAMLRSWYEESNNFEIWGNLRMVIAYSTEYHGKLDIYQSPFNVGLPIELKEFTSEQVTQLIYLHQLDPEIVTPLMSMVGGHPYLIRLALYKMFQDELTIEELLKYAPTESGIYQEHLSRHLETMAEKSNIKAVFQEILKANSPVRLPNKNREVHQLEAMGLITIKGDYAQPRCNLYRQYFQER